MKKIFAKNWCRMAFVVLLTLVGFSVRGADNDAHEAVDLGLPSGTKWASCNVGATCPEQCGDFYSWGEVKTKADYTEPNNPKEIAKVIAGNPEYDAARAKWGGDWRLPTLKECEELCKNCTWKWTTLNGVKGMRVTSKKNKNSIFLPAVGRRVEKENDGVGMNAGYWCGDCDADDSGNYLVFDGFGEYTGSCYRFIGYAVRPVR